jgi:hypothetical protein
MQRKRRWRTLECLGRGQLLSGKSRVQSASNFSIAKCLTDLVVVSSYSIFHILFAGYVSDSWNLGIVKKAMTGHLHKNAMPVVPW